MTREQRKLMRVEISMLHRTANQLEDRADEHSKILALNARSEAERLRLLLKRMQ